MPVHQVHPTMWIQYAITGVIVIGILALRLRGMSKMRRLRLETLWIVPVVYLLIAAFMFYEFPPHGLAWLVCALAVVVGGAVGWQRGKLMHILVDPETHALNQRASPAAFAFIIVLIGVRAGARSLMTAGGDYGMHINTLVVTDVLMAFAVGLFSVTRVEMYLRATRMLADARAGRSATS